MSDSSQFPSARKYIKDNLYYIFSTYSRLDKSKIHSRYFPVSSQIKLFIYIGGSASGKDGSIQSGTAAV